MTSRIARVLPSPDGTRIKRLVARSCSIATAAASIFFFVDGEVLHCRPNYPLVRRRDCPDIAPRALQAVQEFLHLGENLSHEILIEELSCGGLQIGFTEACMNGDHLAAHVVFADIAALVIGIPPSRPIRDVIRKQSALEFPIKKRSPASPAQSVPSQSKTASCG